MDERLRALERASRNNDPIVQAGYRRELERLLLEGYHHVLGDYVSAGGVWLEDLTNQSQRLDAEGLPVENDVPVFRVHGVPHKGERLTVTVRDLLDGDKSPYREQLDWLSRTQARPDGSLGYYGRWHLPCAHALSDVLDALLAYQPQPAQQQDIRARALALFKRRLTDRSWPIMRQRLRYEPQTRRGQEQIQDAVFDVYTGESSMRRAEMVGQSREVRDGQDDQALLVLTGKNAKDTRRIYSAVTGYPAWLYRLHRRPQQQEEWALVLGHDVDYDRFYINAYDYGRAFGWSQSGAKNR